MIHYQHFILDNGLRVYVHEDPSVPTAAVNVLYDVGSRDEHEDSTGFAHLFEHLMFGGSANIPSYDAPLQRVGGENNAFTSPDITNYYITLPAKNLETAFWLESDRMMALSFKEDVLEVQRKVVIEEFKQRYLNQPYGDIWLHLRPLAYTTHPYRWATIGKDISHIEKATLNDVKDFFYKHYLPNNAILVVAGNVTYEQVKQLCKKWFEPIKPGPQPERKLPAEPLQTQARFLEIESKVPVDALYKVFHMEEKNAATYHATDLLSDILGRSKSSRLYERLVQKEKILSSVSAYVTGSFDPGLLVITAKPSEGVSLEEAESAIDAQIDEIKSTAPSEAELNKVKNQAESTLIFSEMEVLNRAMHLAFAATLGNANAVNTESEKIQAVGTQDIVQRANHVLRSENSSTLYYRAIR